MPFRWKQGKEESIVKARMMSFKAPPERLEEIENTYLTSLVPEMEKYQGFAFVLVFRNEDTNETFEVTIWNEEEALLESEREGGLLDWKRNTLESITGNATVVESYDLRLIS